MATCGGRNALWVKLNSVLRARQLYSIRGRGFSDWSMCSAKELERQLRTGQIYNSLLICNIIGSKVLSVSRTEAIVKSGEEWVLDCAEALGNLARTKAVSLIWVQGHCGIEGNDDVQRVAMAGQRVRMAAQWVTMIFVPYHQLTSQKLRTAFEDIASL